MQNRGLRTKEKRLKTRELVTGGKAQTLGKMRKGDGKWKESYEIQPQAKMELTVCKDKNSLTSRNNSLDIWLGKAGLKGWQEENPSTQRWCWRKQKWKATQSLDQINISYLINIGFALLLTDYILHFPFPPCFHFYRLKSFNLVFLSDCIVPSVLPPLFPHSKSFPKCNSKNQEPFVRSEEFSLWFGSNISARFR